jgi:hypothetical protein
MRILEPARQQHRTLGDKDISISESEDAESIEQPFKLIARQYEFKALPLFSGRILQTGAYGSSCLGP